MTLIIDASVAIKWFVDENFEANARHILEYNEDLTAPDFVVTEVANILWKKYYRHEVDASQASTILAALAQSLQELIPIIDLNDRALEIALELDHPVYDCLYLACAERCNGTVITADKRFFNKLQSTTYKGQVRFLDDPDLMLPLHISIEKIEKIIKEDADYNQTYKHIHEELTGEKEFGVLSTRDLEPLLDSPALRKLNSNISNLPEKEIQDILALGWLGQNYSGDDWEVIRSRAETNFNLHNKGDVQYACSLCCYLEEGLAKLRKFQ